MMPYCDYQDCEEVAHKIYDTDEQFVHVSLCIRHDPAYTMTIRDLLAEFMGNIEEWETQIEGSPTPEHYKQLDKIYDLSEVEIRHLLAVEALTQEADTAVTDLANTSPDTSTDVSNPPSPPEKNKL